MGKTLEPSGMGCSGVVFLHKSVAWYIRIQGWERGGVSPEVEQSRVHLHFVDQPMSLFFFPLSSFFVWSCDCCRPLIANKKVTGQKKPRHNFQVQQGRRAIE
jgi:hypothetical protein